jgi:DNA mismatch endonuclease (patch repair protein)
MADTVSKVIRSGIMRRVRSQDTQPELLVRKFLSSNGLRYRINEKKLPGSPDIVLRKYKTVIFINGCFWHGHRNCSRAKLPATNVDYWISKITRNVSNDTKNKALLKKLGWKIITVWECDLRNVTRENTLGKLLSKLISVS